MLKKSSNSKLIKLENQYQKLNYILNTFGSNRIKLEYLRLFLFELCKANNGSDYISYFSELIQEYIQLITLHNVEYRPIEVLESLKLIGDTFIDQNIKGTKSNKFLRSQNILKIQTTLTHIYLSEWYKGLRVFFPTLKQTDFQKVNSELGLELSNSSEPTTLQKYLRALGKDTLKNNKDLKTIMNTLENWENNLTKVQNDRTWVLLVEHESQDVFGAHTKAKDIVAIGNIQQMDTSSHQLPSESATDFVLFNNLSLSYNDLMYQQANTAVEVAKNKLGKDHAKLSNAHNVIYSFLNKESHYSGESLGLAMTLSAISSISKENSFKDRYSLLPDYCITGSIANDGKVNSISNQALAIKLEALFYSPFKKVIIPLGNKKQAVKCLDKFKEKHPTRYLDIIPVNYISDAITNPNIVLAEKTTLITRLQRFWKHWKTAIIIILVVILSIHLFFPFNFDKNPVDLKIGGNKIEVYNTAGKILWDYDFGYVLDIPLSGSAGYSDLPLYSFEDINNDGVNELIIGPQAKDRSISGSVQVFSSTGELIWKYNQHPIMTFGDEVFNDIFSVTCVRIHTFNGEKRIFVSFAKYIWYPSRLVAFDIKGNILGEYWNSGTAHVLQFIDIDDDGTDEIFLGGCNNDYNTAFMAILEHDRISGHSPQINDAYIPKGIPKGTEKYYIKFPDPRNVLLDARRGAIQNIELLDNKLLIREMIGTEDQHRVFYTLNKNLEINSVTVNDAYIAYYNRLTGSDFLTDYPKPKLKEIFYNLEFWNGEKFVLEPVMSNQNYE